MTENTKQQIKNLLNRLNLFSLYRLLLKTSPLQVDGWFRSFRDNAPVDGAGNSIPWIAYPAIEFINMRVKPEMSVFEYGCGGSTSWWASRVKEVVACEHDEKWYAKIKNSLPDNVTLHHVPLEYGGEYAGKVSEFPEKFDIVFIDGRDRKNCAISAVKGLKPNGVIIFDDSNRAEYNEGYQFLFQNGFRKIEFVGMYPLGIIKTETAIFYRSDNVFNI
jgi:hypothetical protein